MCRPYRPFSCNKSITDRWNKSITDMLTTGYEHGHVSSPHHFRHALSQREKKYISSFLIGTQISQRNSPQGTNMGMCAARTPLVTPSHKEIFSFFFFHSENISQTNLPPVTNMGMSAAHTPLVITPSHEDTKFVCCFLIGKKFHKQTYRQPRTWACVQPTPLWSRLLKRLR